MKLEELNAVSLRWMYEQLNQHLGCAIGTDLVYAYAEIGWLESIRLEESNFRYDIKNDIIVKISYCGDFKSQIIILPRLNLLFYINNIRDILLNQRGLPYNYL